MKHPKAFYIFFCWILVFNFSCIESEEKVDDQTDDGFTKKTKINYQPDSTSQIVMIYDYNSEVSKLQFRPVEIQNPSGNYLKDALQAFINHNHFLEPTDNINLEKIDQNENRITLHFSGLANSKEQEDKRDFFIKALELTLARNFQGKEFRIVMHEDFP